MWSQLGMWMWLVMIAAFTARGISAAKAGRGLTKMLKPDYSTSNAPPARIEDPDELARLLWKEGDPAFWLDPDLWHGVGDTHRDLCWMHLDERRPAPAPKAIAAAAASYAPSRPITRALRDDALAALAKANEYEDRGFGALAAELRDDAMTRLRNMLEAEKFAKQFTRPGAVIFIPNGGGPTPVGVNGAVTMIQHGVDVSVPPHVLEALRNSSVAFEDRTPKALPAPGKIEPAEISLIYGEVRQYDDAGNWIGSEITFAPGQMYIQPLDRIPLRGARR